jgi:hypothetical protein
MRRFGLKLTPRCCANCCFRKDDVREAIFNGLTLDQKTEE